MTEEISKAKAIELIKESEHGTLIIGSMEEVPTIGEVPVEDMRFEVSVDSYSFGTLPEIEDE